MTVLLAYGMPIPIRNQRPQLRSDRPVAVRALAREAPSLQIGRTKFPLGQTPSSPGASPDNPYLDYGRFLTPEGGVLLIYKDLDLRWRHTLWRLLAWSVATGSAGWLLYYGSPIHAGWLNVLCFMVTALVNWFIVAKPLEVYRRLEVRPDCLILEGAEVFWRERMDGGLPTLQPDEDGNEILCGVYGTRFVEYGTLRRFDEFDRMPETFAAHLAEAIEQLWSTSWQVAE